MENWDDGAVTARAALVTWKHNIFDEYLSRFDLGDFPLTCDDSNSFSGILFLLTSWRHCPILLRVFRLFSSIECTKSFYLCSRKVMRWFKWRRPYWIQLITANHFHLPTPEIKHEPAWFAMISNKNSHLPFLIQWSYVRHTVTNYWNLRTTHIINFHNS